MRRFGGRAHGKFARLDADEFHSEGIHLFLRSTARGSFYQQKRQHEGEQRSHDYLFLFSSTLLFTSTELVPVTTSRPFPRSC